MECFKKQGFENGGFEVEIFLFLATKRHKKHKGNH
jgi:hypothetical protein